jgi:hypothetical protein
MTDFWTLHGLHTFIGDINNLGQAVGYIRSFSIPNDFRAFLWHDRVKEGLGPGILFEINDRGQAYGNYTSADGNPHAFLVAHESSSVTGASPDANEPNHC